jgi:hypothetical protein
MKKTNAILLLLCLCGLSAGARQIPFELDRYKIILPLRINDSRVLRVILDTGMPSQGALLFKPDLADEINLANVAKYEVKGAGRGETSYVLRGEGMTLSFGDVDFPNQPLMILQSDTMSAFPTDGVVGNVLFGSSVVKIDYDQKLITLLDEVDVEADSGWEAIDMRFNQHNIPFVDAVVSVGGDDRAAVNLYIDSASSEAMELLVKPEMKFSLPEQLEDHYLGRGLSGDIYGQFGSVKSLTIGSFTIQNIPCAFPKAEVRSRQEGADGIVCNRLLQRFHVIFDFSGKKLYLKPNPSFSTPFN